MGKMNLLKASYTAKVGETYGYRRKGQNILCAVPFSHAPHNEKQKNAFSAFSALQKLTGSIARIFKNYTGLNYKNKNPINEIAHFFKNLIVERKYSPGMIEHVLPKIGYIEIVSVKKNIINRSIEIEIKTSQQTISEGNPQYYFGAFNPDYELISEITFSSPEQNITFEMNNPNNNDFILIGIKSILINGKRVMCDGVFYGEGRDVINECWYLDRLSKYATIYIQNETLYINYNNAYVQDENLTINY